MVFCGKCGFQLTSGNRTCPRCGTPIGPELILEESQPDNPTIEASTIFGVNQSYPGTPVATDTSSQADDRRYPRPRWIRLLRWIFIRLWLIPTIFLAIYILNAILSFFTLIVHSGFGAL